MRRKEVGLVKKQLTHNQYEQMREAQGSRLNETDSSIGFKIVGGKNRKGHVYGLGSEAGLFSFNGMQNSGGSNHGELSQMRKCLELSFKKELEEKLSKQAEVYEASLAKVVAEMKAQQTQMNAFMEQVLSHMQLGTESGGPSQPSSNDDEDNDDDYEE